MEFFIFLSTVFTAFLHTLLGPDHYLLFVVLSKAEQWSHQKTIFVTTVCGAGHILSAVPLGIIGITLMLSNEKWRLLEAVRGNGVAWIFIAFGLVYFIQALRRRIKGGQSRVGFTSGILGAVFVLGPCEPLIPLLLYPGMSHHPGKMLLVIGVFGVTTILTMLLAVCALTFGLNFFYRRIPAFSHQALAAALLLGCGLTTKFLGW